MLQCNETITWVQHQAELDSDKYNKIVIYGASWHQKAKVELQNGLVSADMTLVRIPEEQAPKDFKPTPGDYIVKGEITKEIKRLEDLKKFNAPRVMSVADNRRGKLRHWAVIAS